MAHPDYTFSDLMEQDEAKRMGITVDELHRKEKHDTMMKEGKRIQEILDYYNAHK